MGTKGDNKLVVNRHLWQNSKLTFTGAKSIPPLVSAIGRGCRSRSLKIALAPSVHLTLCTGGLCEGIVKAPTIGLKRKETKTKYLQTPKIKLSLLEKKKYRRKNPYFKKHSTPTISQDIG